MSASKWDSYRDTLYKILDEFRPRRIYEFGSGFSTDIFHSYPSVDAVVSVEHDKEYYEKMLTRYYENVTLIYEPDLDRYPRRIEGWNGDLIFIDGRNRATCMEQSKKIEGAIVLLHDSLRDKYQEGIRLFNHRFFTDDGNTCTMTNDKEKAKRIYDALRSIKGYYKGEPL